MTTPQHIRLLLAGITPVIPPEDLEMLLRGECIETDALRFVRTWHDNPGVYFMHGETGRGATMAAAWWLAQSGGLYETATALARDGRRARVWRGNVPRPRFGEPRKVLVIDDIGTERAAFDLDLIEHLRGPKKLRRFSVLLISHLPFAAFYQRYGGMRVARYLRLRVELTGDDLRRPSGPLDL